MPFHGSYFVRGPWVLENTNTGAKYPFQGTFCTNVGVLIRLERYGGNRLPESQVEIHPAVARHRHVHELLLQPVVGIF